MKETVGAQINYTQNNQQETNVVDYDDLWIKTPETTYTSSPGVYVRGSQENEIDALWAGLKDTAPKQTPPIVFAGIGFAAGVVATLFITSILFWGTGDKANFADINKVEAPIIEETQNSIQVPESTLAVSTNTKEFKDVVSYTIQNGDTLGIIAERFYKSSSPKYVNLIQKANNLKSPHSISAGKKLIIPVTQ